MAASTDNGFSFHGLGKVPGLVQPGCGLGLVVHRGVIYVSHDNNGTASLAVHHFPEWGLLSVFSPSRVAVWPPLLWPLREISRAPVATVFALAAGVGFLMLSRQRCHTYPPGPRCGDPLSACGEADGSSYNPPAIHKDKRRAHVAWHRHARRLVPGGARTYGAMTST